MTTAWRRPSIRTGTPSSVVSQAAPAARAAGGDRPRGRCRAARTPAAALDAIAVAHDERVARLAGRRAGVRLGVVAQVGAHVRRRSAPAGIGGGRRRPSERRATSRTRFASPMTSGAEQQRVGPAPRERAEEVGRSRTAAIEHGDAVGPRGMRARTAAGDTGGSARGVRDHAPPSAQNSRDERGLGIPARDPVVEDERDASPAERRGRRRSPARRRPGRGPARRGRRSRAGRCSVTSRGPLAAATNATSGIAVGEVAQRDPVDREGPAGDDDVDVLALDELAGDLRERAELAGLAAAAHDLDSPPGHAHAVHAVARVPAGVRAPRAMSGSCAPDELLVLQRAEGADAVHDDPDAQRVLGVPPHAAAASSTRPRPAPPRAVAQAHARSPTRRRGRRRSHWARRRRRSSPMTRARAGRCARPYRRSRWPPTRAGRRGDPRGSAAHGNGRQDAVGARVDRHDRVVQRVGDPGGPSATTTERGGKGSAIVAWTLPVWASRRHRRAGRARRPSTHSEPAPTASSRKATRALDAVPGSQVGQEDLGAACAAGARRCSDAGRRAAGGPHHAVARRHGAGEEVEAVLALAGGRVVAGDQAREGVAVDGDVDLVARSRRCRAARRWRSPAAGPRRRVVAPQDALAEVAHPHPARRHRDRLG